MNAVGLNRGAIFNDAFYKLDHVRSANLVIPTLAPLWQDMQAQISLVGTSGSLEAFSVFLDVPIRQRAKRLVAGILAVASLFRDRINLVGVTVGTLQVTCSKFGISLPKTQVRHRNGLFAARQRALRQMNSGAEGDGNPTSNGGLHPIALAAPASGAAQIATPHPRGVRANERGEVSLQPEVAVQRRGAND